jgi:hypothetical protein
MKEVGEVKGMWEAARRSASVVGQDKGNASLDRATTGFCRFLRSFSPRQNDARASQYRARHASQYRAANTAPQQAEKTWIWHRRRGLTGLAAAIGVSLIALAVTALSADSFIFESH